MVFYVVTIGVILVCAITIAVIVVKKFPYVMLIDTESLPMEREAKKKKEILQQRVSRQSAVWWQKRLGQLIPYLWKIRYRFRSLYGKMLVLDSQYTKPKVLTSEDIVEKVDILLREAERCLEEGRMDDAEKAYVKIITLDQKNTSAYEGLGDLYFETKQYEQAREMFGFLIRLGVRDCHFKKNDAKGKGHHMMPMRPSLVHDESCAVEPSVHHSIAKHYAKYGKTFEVKGDTRGSCLAYEQAVCFQPSNPRYLDLLLEACILESDNGKAVEVLKKLREVNPENQKLAAFEKRIVDMKELN